MKLKRFITLGWLLFWSRWAHEVRTIITAIVMVAYLYIANRTNGLGLSLTEAVGALVWLKLVTLYLFGHGRTHLN